MKQTAHAPEKRSFEDALSRLPIAPAFKRFIIPADLGRIYSDAASGETPADFVRRMIENSGVRMQFAQSDLERVPKFGPVVAVANHPYGILDGLMLFDLLSRVRGDVKILANSFLSHFREMESKLILVDPFDTPQSKGANRKGMREVLAFLDGGGLLITFPAGEVSHMQLRERKVVDSDWNENTARFVQKTGASVTPIYVKGANSLTFQLAGMIHSQLRTARLLHELMNKQEKNIEIRVGGSVSNETLSAFASADECTQYLRHRTYLLENRARSTGPPLTQRIFQATLRHAEREIVPPACSAEIAAEVGRLPKLASNGDLDVYATRAGEALRVLHEIGRLREITFREVGEGTGNSLDLDQFDQHYHHVFLWDRVHRRIAGAYRLGRTAEILPRFGMAGLYTSTLFHYDAQFFERIGPAVELGRSFICSGYQRQYGPLLLLWRGIGQFISNNPESAIVFGPVSISNSYHPVSRRLIVRYLQLQKSIRPLSELVRPRRKFPTGRRGADNEMIGQMLRDSEELSAVTADIECDGKGIPVLLKQYLKLGGKVLGFNVDPHFSHALDGLILVDLRNTETALLQRYLGKEGTKRFLSYHRSETGAPFPTV